MVELILFTIVVNEENVVDSKNILDLLVCNYSKNYIKFNIPKVYLIEIMQWHCKSLVLTFLTLSSFC